MTKPIVRAANRPSLEDERRWKTPTAVMTFALLLRDHCDSDRLTDNQRQTGGADGERRVVDH
jgi:hypothetical protein